MNLKNAKIFGMEWYVFVFFAIVIFASAVLDLIPNQMIGAIAVLFTLGIILGGIGDWLPIWKDYIGGGALLAFVGAGLLNYFGLLPKCVTLNADGWINGYSFLNVFISFLIVGSLVGMERKMLIKSGSLFIPVILAGVAGSAILGILAGFLMGKTPLEMITAYVLPIMGGGAGAGAVPMAQVYSDVTGEDPAKYLSFALAILALGNIVSILMAVVMDLIGKKFPKLAGGNVLLRDAKKEIAIEDTEKEIENEEAKDKSVTMNDIGAAIFVTSGFFMLGTLTAKKLLPSIMGVSIPNFAYLIIFAASANILGLIPENLRKGLVKCQQFCGEKLVWVQMVGMGIAAIDFNATLSVLSFGNLFAVIMIVAGGVLGAGIFGWIVGFFPVESSITAGLCMSNMGGAGDLAVLGAANRMSLMGYAQISSRIGGAMILLIGSIIFSFL